MRLDRKSNPLMVMLIAGHRCWVFNLPPGELTSMMRVMVATGNLCFSTNLDDMKECDAPESNKMVAEWELAGNVPNTTSDASWASSVVTWLILP